MAEWGPETLVIRKKTMLWAEEISMRANLHQFKVRMLTKTKWSTRFGSGIFARRRWTALQAY
jgi:hypothetical protein